MYVCMYVCIQKLKNKKYVCIQKQKNKKVSKYMVFGLGEKLIKRTCPFFNNEIKFCLKMDAHG